jgi:hypothetical protein
MPSAPNSPVVAAAEALPTVLSILGHWPGPSVITLFSLWLAPSLQIALVQRALLGPHGEV